MDRDATLWAPEWAATGIKSFDRLETINLHPIMHAISDPTPVRRHCLLDKSILIMRVLSWSLLEQARRLLCQSPVLVPL